MAILKAEELLLYKNEQTQMLYELEVSEVLANFGTIKEDGKIPTKHLEKYFSRKVVLKQILDELIKASLDRVQNNISVQKSVKANQVRLWISAGPVNEEMMDSTLELVGFRSKDHLYVEFKLESGEWPSAKEKIGSTLRDANRSQGCINLGNTCYMNASL